MAKTTPLKNNKFSQKSDIFWRKILEKDLQLFSKLFSQNFSDFDQKWLLLHSLSKLLKKKKKKKNLPKWKIWVGLAHKTGFSFSWPYGRISLREHYIALPGLWSWIHTRTLAFFIALSHVRFLRSWGSNAYDLKKRTCDKAIKKTLAIDYEFSFKGSTRRTLQQAKAVHRSVELCRGVINHSEMKQLRRALKIKACDVTSYIVMSHPFSKWEKV